MTSSNKLSGSSIGCESNKIRPVRCNSGLLSSKFLGQGTLEGHEGGLGTDFSGEVSNRELS